MSQIEKDKAYLETVASSLLGEKYILVNQASIENIMDYISKSNQIKADDGTLKSYFETGDKPSELEFSELIDSKMSRGESYLKGEVYTRQEIDAKVDVIISEKASVIQRELERKMSIKIVEEIDKKTEDLEADIKQMGEDIYIQAVEKTNELLVQFEKDFNDRITVMVRKIVEDEYGIIVL